MKEPRELSKKIRNFRRYHKLAGIYLLTFILISGLTGLLLTWKKNFSLLQPKTQHGVSSELKDWMSLQELSEIAKSEISNIEIDRMDVRPEDGIVKVLFTEGNWEVQLDGVSGEVLSVGRRHSDWIEKLHDLSIISDGTKLVTMNILGVGLVGMVITGYWLYFGPGKIRKRKGLK